MSKKLFSLLKKELPGVRRKVLLKNYTTFKVGGPAEYFFIASAKEELMKALAVAKKLRLKTFVFGGGSNLIVSDKGLKGLVIKLGDSGKIVFRGNYMTAGGGITMAELVDASIQHALAGLEWAGGLPGSFGGAIRGNAGAFGGEIKDTFFTAEVLDHHEKTKEVSNTQARFRYRSSILKEKNWVALEATLKLRKGNRKELRAIADSRIAYRQKNHPMEYPSAGSIFKNVPVKGLRSALRKAFADKIKQDPFPIIPAAWFIIGAGLTGKKIGKAQISEKHSNYIVNRGGAKANDIIRLIRLVQKTVQKKYGILLEPEPMVV